MNVEDLIRELTDGLKEGRYDRQDRVRLSDYRTVKKVRKDSASTIIIE